MNVALNLQSHDRRRLASETCIAVVTTVVVTVIRFYYSLTDQVGKRERASASTKGNW